MFRLHCSQQDPSKARSWSQQAKSANCGSSSSSERVSLRLQVYKGSWSRWEARSAGCGGFQHSPGISASQRVAPEHAHESGIIGFLNLQRDPRSRVHRSRQRAHLQPTPAAKTSVPNAKDLKHAEKWLQIFAGDLMGRPEEQDAASSSRRPRAIAPHHSIEGRLGSTRSKQTQIPPGAETNAKLLFNLSRALLIQISQEGLT